MQDYTHPSDARGTLSGVARRATILLDDPSCWCLCERCRAALFSPSRADDDDDDADDENDPHSRRFYRQLLTTASRHNTTSGYVHVTVILS